MDWMTDWFDRITDEQLRRASAHLLFWSLVAMVLNVSAYLAGIISGSVMLFITLVLSWFAIVIGAANTLITTDVKKSIDEDSTGP